MERLFTSIVRSRTPASSFLSAGFSTKTAGQSVIVREYIRSAFQGNFAKLSRPNRMLLNTFNHSEVDRFYYMNYLDDLYRENGIAWLTPLELLKPWYAFGIAEAILRMANLSTPLKIYEIGGGSGNCAKYIMDYISGAYPKVYESMSYSSVEISPSLSDIQLETVGGKNENHSKRFSVECRDASDRKGWGDVEPGPCWVIMLQVLENLPHDLVYSPNLASPWTEVWLERMADSFQVFEVYKPIQDKLIAECIKIIGMDKDLTSGSILTSTVKSMWSKAFPRPQRAWIPTGCLQLLEALHWALPKMSLIASDFSYLPNIKIAGDRAPLVFTKKDGKTVDHSCYLDAKGDADIFFPTDFWLLERMDHHCSGCSHGMAGSVSLKPEKQRRTITLDTAAFMKEFGLTSRTTTKDGYSPLLDEFQNTKFYLSVPAGSDN